MIRILFLVFLWSISGSFHVSYAQKAIISEGISIRNDHGYEIIGRMRDRFLLFRDRYDNFEVQAFDGLLQLAWNKELEDLDRRNTQIMTVVSSRNDFSVIFTQKRRGQTYLRVYKYDPGANLIDTATIKNYGERLFSPPNIEITLSEDRNYLVATNFAERSHSEITCFRIDLMKVVWDKDYLFEVEGAAEHRPKVVCVNNKGACFLFRELNNRKSKIEQHSMSLIQLSDQPDQQVSVAANAFLTVDIKFAWDYIHGGLIGAGLYGVDTREKVHGAFFLKTFDGSGAYTLHSEGFDKQFYSILKRKDINNEVAGIEDADAAHLVVRHDGGAVLISECHYEYERGMTAGRGMMREGARLIVDYYYDDVFTVAFQPNGKIQWKTVLHKKQYSQDDDATFSSFMLMRQAEQIRFLFNDEIKSDNTCSEYTIDPTGQFDRNSLINTLNQPLRLRFRDGVQINAEECIIPSEYRNKLRLVLIRY